MKHLSVAFALAAALTQAVALADGNSGMVRGTVVRWDGQPIANATIYWVNPSGMGYAKTNASGRFYLFNVFPGLTTISSSTTGYSSGCVRGHVQANETVDIVMHLYSRESLGCGHLHSSGRAAVQDRY